MVAAQLRSRGIRDERVLRAMESVPRHLFVPERLRTDAYEDNPVAIGEGQTISQPFIVAYMLQMLDVAPENRVLEIGTGTGYEAALLAELAGSVFSIERVLTLALQAREILSALGYKNVEVIHADGTRGLPDHAPFDRIIVAAASPEVPSSLFDQLVDGGRMIIPVGSRDFQDLLLVRKVEGRMELTVLEGCRFVPLIGDQGF